MVKWLSLHCLAKDRLDIQQLNHFYHDLPIQKKEIYQPERETGQQ